VLAAEVSAVASTDAMIARVQVAKSESLASTIRYASILTGL
jgi:hypothetical protein